VGGKAITEDSTYFQLLEYQQQREENNTKEKTNRSKQNLHKSPQPSTSKGNIVDSDIESEIEDEDPANNCCICKKFSPPGLDQCDEQMGPVHSVWSLVPSAILFTDQSSAPAI
jgi:hypothetical protein